MTIIELVFLNDENGKGSFTMDGTDSTTDLDFSLPASFLQCAFSRLPAPFSLASVPFDLLRPDAHGIAHLQRSTRPTSSWLPIRLSVFDRERHSLSGATHSVHA